MEKVIKDWKTYFYERREIKSKWHSPIIVTDSEEEAREGIDDYFNNL